MTEVNGLICQECQLLMEGLTFLNKRLEKLHFSIKMLVTWIAAYYDNLKKKNPENEIHLQQSPELYSV